ncbi:MAG: hypothetical protein LBH98_06970 [Chitinispirillales bacterium]|jgi:hypothetical protein|nr:hypothetical protein [Chitinispirillales bacterium]
MNKSIEKFAKILLFTIIIIVVILIVRRYSQYAFKCVNSNPVTKMFDYSDIAVESEINEKKNVVDKVKYLNDTDININNAESLVWISGFRNANDISEEIKFHAVSMKYKFHLHKITPPSQQVIVKILIDKYGRVSDPQVISPDTLSENSRNLILSDLMTWQFVQIKQDGKTIASFPLNLKNRLQSQ